MNVQPTPGRVDNPSLPEGEPPEGFDPPTCSLRNCRSAGLSYGGMCVIAFIQPDWAGVPTPIGGAMCAGGRKSSNAIKIPRTSAGPGQRFKRDPTIARRAARLGLVLRRPTLPG